MIEFLKKPMNLRAEDDLKKIIVSMNDALKSYNEKMGAK